jgi:hypothetical protein
VAGFQPVGNGEGAIALDPNAVPGIGISGKAQLIVNGTVVVNSKGGGVDQFGNTVTTLVDGSTPLKGNAIATGSLQPAIVAQDVQVVGGVDTLSNFSVYNSALTPPYDLNDTDRPVFARAPIAPDPLISLPTPDSTNNPWYNTVFPDPKVSSGTVTLNPGVYSSGITITGGTANLNPGIYVIYGGNLKINGGAVTGNGVMFYLTNDGFNATTGLPDANDGSTQGSTSNGNTLNMSGTATVSLTPYNTGNSPFNGILFYQRRQDTASPNITGNGTSTSLTGTIYAKWAQFQIGGQGQYNAQFVVGSMILSGQAAVTINATGKNFGRANLVFLVE